MKVLIIDDCLERHDEFNHQYDGHEVDHAYGYDDAINLLERSYYDLVSFDHDLGDFDGKVERNGATIARYMGNNGIKCGRVVIHSHNVIGAENIRSIVKSAEIADDCVYSPFAIFHGADMVGLVQDFQALSLDNSDD